MHANGYIQCHDIDALEDEMWAYGRQAVNALNDNSFTKATLHNALHSRAV